MLSIPLVKKRGVAYGTRLARPRLQACLRSKVALLARVYTVQMAEQQVREVEQVLTGAVSKVLSRFQPQGSQSSRATRKACASLSLYACQQPLTLGF